jgi:Skp family chaperone for outer membrane proteins
LFAQARWRATARACFVVAALGLVAAPGFAATYKWTDANGRVVYSDQPPTGDIKVEAISAPPPPANPNAAKELASKEAEVQQRRLMRAEADSKATKARLEADSKREQCGKVRGQLTMLQSDQTRVYRSNEKGEPVYIDDAGRRKERQQLEVWLRENCTT